MRLQVNRQNKELLEMFEKTGAFLKGHFELSSGLHSSGYVQCALVLQYPEMAERLGRLLSEPFMDKGIEVVVSPALGGVIIGHETAKALRARAVFAERKYSPDGTSKIALRRGFGIGKEEKVLVVEDVVTTGGSTREILRLVSEAKGAIAGVGCLIDRSSGRADFRMDALSLLDLDIKTYNVGECPLCRKGIPVTKPGSRQGGKKGQPDE